MNTTNNFRNGSAEFRPMARLVSVLGEQLIRDAAIGVLELVKNGYDADADQVTVRLLNLKQAKIEYEEASRLKDEVKMEEALEKITIVVEDDGDGDGMLLDTILNTWLIPRV
jgi:hypothetical protein